MKTKVKLFIALILMVVVTMSCGKKQETLVVSRDFKSEQWGRFDFIEADYAVIKAPMTADVVLDIVVSDVYPNIYPSSEDGGKFSISLCINAPDGGRRSREYNFRLKDSDGRFKSEKIDGYYHYSLPLINEMNFYEAGNYHFKIENKYSKDPLCGIKSLTINCLKSQK